MGCATITPVWAQGKGAVAVWETVRDLSSNAQTVSHLSQAAATTPTIAKQVVQVATVAQANQALSGEGLSAWAQHLITPETKPEIATLFSSLSRNLDFIHTTKSQFTEEQLARIEEAESYFSSLTPQQANSIHTLASIRFRRHAMTLRSPKATEQGYFFTGSNLLREYESFLHRFNEYGYIPFVLGHPSIGIPAWNMDNLMPHVVKTDRPIFVLLDMHGGIDSQSRFFVRANPSQRLSTEEIVTEIRKLRQATGASELNLFVNSCYSGAFLDEFESLASSQRQGINVFVPTGAGQCAFISASAPYHVHTPGADITKELVEKMIEQIVNGRILAQANIAGQSFNPLELAIQKANALSDYNLANYLSLTFNLQKTKQTQTARPSLCFDENIRYFIARTAYEEATARYGQIFERNNWFTEAMQQLKDTYAQRHHISPEDWILEERYWDGRFAFKPLK